MTNQHCNKIRYYLCAYANASNLGDVLKIPTCDPATAAQSFAASNHLIENETLGSTFDIHVEPVNLGQCLRYRIELLPDDGLRCFYVGLADRLLSTLPTPVASKRTTLCFIASKPPRIMRFNAISVTCRPRSIPTATGAGTALGRMA